MSLKQLIKQKNLSQQIISEILCKKYHHFKYQQQISEWCLGIRLPDILSVYYLSKILDVSTDTIIESVLDISNDRS